MHVFDTEAFYEDTDQSGIVYHANYLKFIERGRSAYVRALGIDQRRLLARDGLAFAVAALEARFLRPARFEDRLRVTTVPVAVHGARLVLDQEVRRASETLFAARVTVVCLRADGRPARLPAELRQALAPPPA